MTNPTLITTPFAENGDKNDIPEVTGVEPQNATLEKGFPEITQTPISAGGIPPERKDFNGILNLYGQHIVHLNKGLPYEFDAAFATAIGGYPLHARIMLSNGDIVQNTVANNTNNPNSNMTGWINPKYDSFFGISTINDLSSIPSIDNKIIFLKEKNSNYYLDLSDTSSISDGYSTIIDPLNRKWKIITDFYFAEKYNIGSIPKVFSAKYMISIGQKNLGNISLRMRNQLEGSGYGTQLVDTTIDYNQNQVQLKDFRILNSDPEKYGVVNSDTAGDLSYFSEISNVTVNNGSGFKNGGVETYFNNCRVFSQDRANRVEKGFYCTETVLGDANTAIDTSFSMIYSQGAKQGFNSRGAVIGYDGHFVWADTALRLEGTNSLTALPTQRSMFGLYLDKAYTTAAYLYGTTGVSLYSPFIYELGMYQTDTAETVTGIRFQENATKNFVSAATFNVADLSKVYSLLWFSSTSVDNTFIHLNGSYKLNSTHLERMRKQNVIAGTGEWARHNNFARLNRGVTGLINAGASTSVVITLDYAYPISTMTFNALLFVGNYITRLDNMDYQMGDIYIAFRVINGSSIIPNVQLVSRGGYNPNNLSWAATTATLSGNELTITLQNNATSAARMSLEVKRSVDTSALAF